MLPFVMKATSYGELLREMRTARGVSQVRLAHEAQVSTRHLSFLETGRALPSREMVVQLCEALDIAPRQRNSMLLAAGYAPMYRERSLESAELAAIRAILARLIESHAPFPTIVLDGAHEIVMMNSAAARLRKLTANGGPEETNLLRWLLSPGGLRPFITNWEHVASHVVRRVRREMRSPAERATLERLIEQSLAGTPLDTSGPPAAPPLIAVQWRFGDATLSTMSAITTFGTSADITLDELRIETVLPIDAASDAVLRALLAQSS